MHPFCLYLQYYLYSVLTVQALPADSSTLPGQSLSQLTRRAVRAFRGEQMTPAFSQEIAIYTDPLAPKQADARVKELVRIFFFDPNSFLNLFLSHISIFATIHGARDSVSRRSPTLATWQLRTLSRTFLGFHPFLIAALSFPTMHPPCIPPCCQLGLN